MQVPADSCSQLPAAAGVLRAAVVQCCGCAANSPSPAPPPRTPCCTRGPPAARGLAGEAGLLLGGCTLPRAACGLAHPVTREGHHVQLHPVAGGQHGGLLYVRVGRELCDRSRPLCLRRARMHSVGAAVLAGLQGPGRSGPAGRQAQAGRLGRGQAPERAARPVLGTSSAGQCRQPPGQPTSAMDSCSRICTGVWCTVSPIAMMLDFFSMAYPGPGGAGQRPGLRGRASGRPRRAGGTHGSGCCCAASGPAPAGWRPRAWRAAGRTAAPGEGGSCAPCAASGGAPGRGGPAGRPGPPTASAAGSWRHRAPAGLGLRGLDLAVTPALPAEQCCGQSRR